MSSVPWSDLRGSWSRDTIPCGCTSVVERNTYSRRRRSPVDARSTTGYGASERSRAEGDPNGCHGNRYIQNGRGHVLQGVQGSSRLDQSARRIDLSLSCRCRRRYVHGRFLDQRRGVSRRVDEWPTRSGPCGRGSRAANRREVHPNTELLGSLSCRHSPSSACPSTERP